MDLFKKFLKTFGACLPIVRRRRKKTLSRVPAATASPSPFHARRQAYGDDISFASSEASEQVFIHVPLFSPAVSSVSVNSLDVDTDDGEELSLSPVDSGISDSAVPVDDISPSPSISGIPTEAAAKVAPPEATPTLTLSRVNSDESLAPVPAPYASQISPSPSGESMLQFLACPPRFIADISPSPSIQSLEVHSSFGLSQVQSLECMRR